MPMPHSSAPLIINHEVKERLKDLAELANQKPVDVSVLAKTLKTATGRKKHLKNMMEQTVTIGGPWEFFVTFSIETGHPIGTCRHMSMSIKREGRVPSKEAVWMVAEEIGFFGGLESMDAVYSEELSDGGVAVNIIQRVSDVLH